jgi:hypothetical protein
MPAHDVLETLTLVLATGLASQLMADLLRLPRMVLLLAAGISLGPHALDAVELPLDSAGVELVLTLGVGFIIFHGGVGLSLRVLRSVALGLGLLAVPGASSDSRVRRDGPPVPSPTGKLLDRNRLMGRYFRPAAPRAGFGEFDADRHYSGVVFHDLRHTFISLMAKAGFTPRRVVREQARDLGDGEHEGQVKEELERGDLVLVAVLELALGVGHARTLAQRRARPGSLSRATARTLMELVNLEIDCRLPALWHEIRDAAELFDFLGDDAISS